MSFVDRGLRMVARLSGVHYSRLATRSPARRRPRQGLKALGALPFGVTDCSAWDATQIARDIKARRWDLCCLDVLHNLPYRDTQEMDRNIAILAAAARTSGTHLILVCHPNETAGEGRDPATAGAPRHSRQRHDQEPLRVGAATAP